MSRNFSSLSRADLQQIVILDAKVYAFNFLSMFAIASIALAVFSAIKFQGHSLWYLGHAALSLIGRSNVLSSIDNHPEAQIDIAVLLSFADFDILYESQLPIERFFQNVRLLWDGRIGKQAH